MDYKLEKRLWRNTNAEKLATSWLATMNRIKKMEVEEKFQPGLGDAYDRLRLIQNEMSYRGLITPEED